LTRVAELVPEDERQPVAIEALDAVANIPEDYYKAKILVRLAPLLSSEIADQAVMAAQTVADINHRVDVLDHLRPAAATGEFRNALTECLRAARKIGDTACLDQALSAFRPLLSDGGLNVRLSARDTRRSRSTRDADANDYSPKELDTASKLADRVLAEAESRKLDGLDGDEQWLGFLLGSLPTFSGKERAKVVDALIKAISAVAAQYENAKRGLLAELATHLEPESALRAWDVALSICRPDNRVEALGALGSRLPESKFASALAEILHLSPEVSRWQLLQALAASAPAIYRLGGETAVRETVDAISEVGRWWP
jgi:hypothetical protein